MTPRTILFLRRRAACAPRLLPVAVAVALAAACGGDIPAADEPAAAEPVRVSGIMLTADQIQHGGVAWGPVEEMTMTDSVTVPGVLAPNEDRTVRVSAPSRARVATVHVRVGDQTRPGQPLVTLQSENAAMARAEHAKAVAELRATETAARYARTALERAERLLELKAVSRQDVELARVENEAADVAHLQAEADVERTRATLDQLGVDADTGAMVLAAPFEGTVLARDVVPGSVVEAGTLLVTVTDATTLWLEISATERVAPLVRPGSDVSFTVADLLPETFQATIENVSAALDPMTRTLAARGLVPNPEGRLRPAMFATVVVSVGQPRDGVGVPESAMQLLDERPVVFVATPGPDGSARFERRDVEVGPRANDRVHVVSGLSPGDVVVIEGAFAVKSEFVRSEQPTE